MKHILLVTLIISTMTISTQLFANNDSEKSDRVEVMQAEGDKEMSIGTLLSPPGFGAVGRAQMMAKKNLKEKCKSELNGKITGKIQYETLSFDEGDMTAHVQATGNCKY